ncbi:DUF5702 domain-containing protein [uncultured Clostridium sp.]|uniref:DUF5702 domain-containing protein n=1 Tax=uncultured Clostridium sp. TaxID=59620 RepID=UPI0025D045ED|nr:DUF5702 domain-containing protein [uncultured Clostridium sp.]
MRDKNEKGVITVFLALVFGLLLTFLINLVNVTMVNSAKNQMIIASDAAITSALAGYDRDLFSDYGLLSFEENSDMITALNKIFMENLNGNAGLNGMFNYDDTENELSAVTGGNIFEDNQLMKKQMIYAMKYQGTENLFLYAFDKIKKFVNSKDIIKEVEEVQEVDKNIDKLDEEITSMQENKYQALEALVELAKNNKYEYLGRNRGIGYIESISAEELRGYYQGNNSVLAAIDSVASYNGIVYLPKIYSYAYTKLVLLMYKEYLEIAVQQQQTAPATGTSVQVGSNTINVINELIRTLDNKITEEKSKLSQKLDAYIQNLNSGISAVDTLISKHAEIIQPAIDKYKNTMESSENQDVKDIAEQSYKEYSELLSLENLGEVKEDFNNIKRKLNSVINEINEINNINTDYSNLGIRDWVNNNIDDYAFEVMGDLIGPNFRYPPSIENFIGSICGNEYLDNIIIENEISEMQIDTIGGIAEVSNATIMEKPQDNAQSFKDFYKMFKQIKEEEEGKREQNNGSERFDGESDRSFEPVNPINREEGENDGSNSDKLSDKLNQVDSSYNLDLSTDIINSGAGFLDKLYLIEYVMTNFTDISSEFKSQDSGNTEYKRIPELNVNDENALKYELEAIIAGEYDDEKNDTTLENDIFAIRMVLNTVSLMTKQDKLKIFIDRVSDGIALATVGAIPTPVARAIITLAWAALESTYDVIDIYNGYSVPVFKEELNDWVTKLGLTSGDFEKPEESMDLVNKNEEPVKNNGAYNNQENNFSLNYTDMMRFVLLITKSDKIIDGSQNLIIENQKIRESYTNYKSNIEVNVEKSKLNILFNTDVFSSREGHRFNSFTFKKGYN